MSISVVGIAVGAIFATKVMSITGRKLGFIYASIGNSLISLLAAYSIMDQNFILQREESCLKDLLMKLRKMKV